MGAVEFDEFIAAGLYDPDAANAAERHEFLELLLERGFSAAQIIEVSQLDIPVPDFLPALAHASDRWLSARDIATSAGMTVEEVEEVRHVLGLPVTSPDAAEIPESFLGDIALIQVGSAMFGWERALGFTRVVGAAVSALAEAGRELTWAPTRETALTEREIALASEAAIQTWALIPELIRHLMNERMARDAWFREDLRRGEVSMGVAFVDLVGSTEWTARLTPDEHKQSLGRFENDAARLAGRYGCRVVKFIGDEAMLVGADPHAVVRAAAHLSASATIDNDLPDARGAVAAGVVTPRAGDYFGEVVNIAARASKLAKPGTIVVTAALAGELDTSNLEVGAPQSVELRGVNGPVDLVEVSLRATGDLAEDR